MRGGWNGKTTAGLRRAFGGVVARVEAESGDRPGTPQWLRAPRAILFWNDPLSTPLCGFAVAAAVRDGWAFFASGVVFVQSLPGAAVWCSLRWSGWWCCHGSVGIFVGGLEGVVWLAGNVGAVLLR